MGEHCVRLWKKVQPRTAQLRKLTGCIWGLQEPQLRVVANGYIRGALEYTAAAWLLVASDSHVELLERETRAAARVITSCPVSTPVDPLMADAGMVPVRVRPGPLAWPAQRRPRGGTARSGPWPKPRPRENSRPSRDGETRPLAPWFGPALRVSPWRSGLCHHSALGGRFQGPLSYGHHPPPFTETHRTWSVDEQQRPPGDGAESRRLDLDRRLRGGRSFGGREQAADRPAHRR